MPLSDHKPPPLVLIQLELLDSYRFRPLAVRRFDRADMFAFAAHDDDTPATQIGGLLGMGTPGHVANNNHRCSAFLVPPAALPYRVHVA